VLRERIELSTSPLPRECSTTELPQPVFECGGLLPQRIALRKHPFAPFVIDRTLCAKSAICYRLASQNDTIDP
jgi:hypothetical protein